MCYYCHGIFSCTTSVHPILFAYSQCRVFIASIIYLYFTSIVLVDSKHYLFLLKSELSNLSRCKKCKSNQSDFPGNDSQHLRTETLCPTSIVKLLTA